MKAILFSFVVLALGCSQVPKKAEPNPLTILLEKQADWQSTENDLRNQRREALRAAEEAERRALDLANDSKDLELQAERLAAENKELRSHAKSEAATRQQAEARIRQLEQHAEALKGEFSKLSNHTKAEATGRQKAIVRLQELEQHAGRLQAETNKLREHAKAEGAARKRFAERTHQLEKRVSLLQRQLGEAHKMTESFARQTSMLLKLLSAPTPRKPDAIADCSRGKNCRHHHRAPRR